MTQDAIRALGALDELRQIVPTEQIESHRSEAGGASYAVEPCLLYTSPSPRDATLSRMPSSA